MEGLTVKRVLVTGGAGFLGSHLVMNLLDLGHDVSVLDIYFNKEAIFSSEQLHSKVKTFFLDIRQREKVFDLFKQNKFDYVFHLAAEPIVGETFKNPISAFETNIMGTVNILEAARLFNTPKGIIVASSDKAYGKTDKAYNEDSPLRGDHPYDVSKSCCDLIANTYYKTYGLPVVITRFGNIYGEGDLHLERIIPSLCISLANNSTLEIRSNGKYIRDYLYVGDVVDGYIFLMNHMKQVVGNAYNFSSNDTYSVLDLVKLAEKTFKTKIKYKVLNNAKNEIPYQHLNDKKIKSLGWENHFSLESSLPQILSWYKDLLEKK